MKSLIELNNISFNFNNKPILRNINLKINEGEKIALIGKSGVGKTTLISISVSYTHLTLPTMS